MPVAKDTRPTYTHNYGNTALHVCRLAYWLAAMTAPIAAYHAKLSTLCTLISELCIQAAGEQDWSIWSWRRRIRSGEYLCTAPSPPPGGRNSAPTARSKWGIYRNVLELHDCCAYCLVICSTNTYKMFVMNCSSLSVIAPSTLFQCCCQLLHHPERIPFFSFGFADPFTEFFLSFHEPTLVLLLVEETQERDYREETLGSNEGATG